MKKTVFTICALIAVCTVIFLACSKDDTAGSKKVNYSSISNSSGTGNNPNPNNNPSSSGYSTAGTTTSTTVTTCTKSMTYDGATCTGLASSISGNTLVHASSCGTAIITFPGSGAPASGAYTVVTGTLSAGQCNYSVGGVYASGGSITIATGSNNKATYSGLVCGTHTISGTACY
jgi:hypothetical protein